MQKGLNKLSWCAGAIGAVGMVFAVVNRFVQDDAYISFRYARNLFDGLGLVWNPGERVEGYTNFLWTVMMSPAFALKCDVVLWSYVLSIASFAATLWLLWQLSKKVIGDADVPGWVVPVLAPLALMATNYSITSYATGGLETAFVTMLVLLSVWLLPLTRDVDSRLGWVRPAMAGLVGGAAILTRMDAVLLLAPFWLAAWLAVPGRFFRVWTNNGRRQLLLGALVAAGICLAWLLWRHDYYGYWLPNTFLIKGKVSPVRGACWMAAFVLMYGWWLLPLGLFAGRRGKSQSVPAGGLAGRGPIVYALAASAVTWLSYVVMMGGDFMEFRMLIPSLPLVCLLFGVAAKTIPGPKGRRFVNAIVIGVVVLGMVGLPRWWPLRLFQPIWLLKSFAVEWRENGEELVKLLGPDARDVKIAVSPAGIIPFTTGLPAFDNLGLNTREVAMSGLDIHPAYKLLGNWPGHTKMASWRQLEEARVNLLINDPWIVPASQVPEIRARLKVDADGHPDPDAINAAFPYLHVALSPRAKPRLIVLPYPGDRAWLMLYLKPHAAVDRLLEKVQSRPQAADRPVNPSSNPL